MSHTRETESRCTRFPAGLGRAVTPITRQKAFILEHGLRVIDKSEQDQVTTATWAARIKDVTSRLSRPTISSSLKSVNMVQAEQMDKNCNFWKSMAYCSNQYERKFSVDAPQTSRHYSVPGIRSQSSIGGFSRKQTAPSWVPGHKPTSSLPALTNQRVFGPRP